MRQPLAALALVPLLLGVVGCATDEDDPTSWTEEEAYAAAEETYSSFHALLFDDELGYGGNEEYLEFLTGERRQGETESRRALDAEGVSIHGESVLVSFEGREYAVVGDAVSVVADICLDDSGVLISEDGGQAEVREYPFSQLRVSFLTVDGNLKISEIELEGQLPC